MPPVVSSDESIILTGLRPFTLYQFTVDCNPGEGTTSAQSVLCWTQEGG